MKIFFPGLIILLTLIQRFYYSTVVHPPGIFLQSDIAVYGGIADAILAGDWKVSHFFQPAGFPMILAAIKFFTDNWSYWLAVIHAILGTATVYVIAKSAGECWGKMAERTTLIAGLIHVPWILYTGYAMPETIYTFLLSLLLYASLKIVRGQNAFRWSVGWGILFIISFYIKGQHAFLLPLFLGTLTLFNRRAFRYSVTMGLVVITGMALHWNFSRSMTGVGKISADTGGLNLVEGKCPSKKNTDPETGITWWSPLYHSLHMDQHKKWDRPFSDSSYYRREGVKCIVKKPWVLVQSLENVPYLFFGNSLWPTNWQPMGEKVRLYEVLFVFFAIPGLLIFFLMMALHQRKEELLVWGLPVLSLFLCVYVFKSEIRYRIPFDVFIVPMALQGWATVIAAVRSARSVANGSTHHIHQGMHGEEGLRVELLRD